MIYRQIDQLGRIVIPADYRDTLGLNAGDTVEISVSNDGTQLIIAPVRNRCAVCGSQELLVTVKTSHVCASCVTDGYKRLSELNNQ